MNQLDAMKDSAVLTNSGGLTKAALAANPALRVVQGVWAEYVAMNPIQKIGSTAHMIFIVPLMLYFSSEVDWSTDTLETAVPEGSDSDLANNSNSFASSFASTFSSSFASTFANSRDNFEAFLGTAAEVNPLLFMLPFFFVVVLTLLNILSVFTLRTPLLNRVWNLYYNYFADKFADPRWLRDFTLDVRPLLLSWCLLLPPVLIIFMIVNFFRSLFQPLFPKPKPGKQFGIECLRLKQQLDKSDDPQRRNFYNSPWFTTVAMSPFVLGIPGAISLWIFFHFGVNATLGHPEHSAEFHKMSTILFYLYPLGWCLSALFFRSYFTFALNFCSTEYDIEIYPDVIKSLPLKGWFFDFMTFRSFHCPSEILWKNVISIKFETSKLDPNAALPDNQFVTFMRKINCIYESVANKLDIHTDCLVIRTKDRPISVRLWELSPEQKLQLFKTIREHAPFIHLDASVQQALVGSSVLREPKYTEIWFSALTSDNEHAREGELKAGQTLRTNRYSVIKKIASGGQAVIYKASTESGEVILKEFQLTQGESFDVKMESAKDFENESALLDQLDHPAIVKLLDMFYERGRVYLVLQHVEGVSLRQYVTAKGKLSASEVMSLAEQMCDILLYLHSKTPPIVHRDFTPDNIILQPDGKLMLIDFSVARQKKEKSTAADCAGKHAYTPPEQFRGATEPQSDIYALGATLFFLVQGEDPKPITESRLQSGYELTAEELALSAIIERATKLEMANRYESVTWLLTDLKASRFPRTVKLVDLQGQDLEETGSALVDAKETEAMVIPVT